MWAREDALSSILLFLVIVPFFQQKPVEQVTQGANLPFLGKVIEWVAAFQLQSFLDETDCLDIFQSGFRLGLVVIYSGD